MEPRVQRAIDTFLDALNEGTLAAGTCRACAVGNLVAKGMGISVKVPTYREHCEETMENEHWMANILVYKHKVKSRGKYQDTDKGKKCIESTEFTLDELFEIERAFELNSVITFEYYHKFNKEQIRLDQINGLEAVVKVMLSFSDSKEDVKEIFTNKAELIPIK